VNIHNFTNRNLCEYASIYPTVASLLDHLLFTIGNGYDFDEDSGMIVDGDGQPIDEYPAMTADEWKALIEKCHAKERKWAEEFKRYGNSDGTVDEEYLAENCKLYKIVNVNDSMFTEDALYAELVETSRLRSEDKYRMENYLRPYPLSERYSDIFNLNLNTPTWFVQIALNLCKAWVRFLNEEIQNNHVWIKHSLRTKKPDPALVAGMNELFDAIKADPDYDGWADKVGKANEPESDYGDLTWTTKHRDMLAAQVQRLEGLLDV
jgi:hypothetical protein